MMPSKGFCNNSGFTLLELLVSMALLGLVVGSLHHVLAAGMTTYGAVDQKQALLAEARLAMQRITQSVAATDAVSSPDSGAVKEILTVSERYADHHNNSDHTYVAVGDGYLDADTDQDGLVNEDTVSGDTPEWITFGLDKTDSSNWRLTETRPDYTTAAVNDTAPPMVLVAYVTQFECRLAAPNLVEIALALDNGSFTVALHTRVYIRHVD